MEKTIEINGNTYILKEEPTDIYMIRTINAGVFFGEIAKRKDKSIILKNARRVWYWDGAATLSELATNGTFKPDECKFPIAMNEIELFEVIEIIPVTSKALKTLNNVKVWTEHK